MGKLSFLAGMAAGYVLGAKAGTRRYEQIRRTSQKVWHSQPVQKQVASAKEVARTKAAPVVADLVADAAKATGEKLRQGRTIASEAVSHESGTSRPSTPDVAARAHGSTGTDDVTPPHGDPWAAATRPTSGD